MYEAFFDYIAADGIKFERLSEKHRDELSHFDCGDPLIDEFVKEHIFKYQSGDLGTSHVLLDADGKVVSFVTLAMSAIKLPVKIRTEKMEKGKIYDQYRPIQFPALKIGMLGTRTSEQRKGYATRLIQHTLKIALEMRKSSGCCFLVVDAVPDNVAWYKAHGFLPLKETAADDRTLPMYMRIPKE